MKLRAFVIAALVLAESPFAETVSPRAVRTVDEFSWPEAWTHDWYRHFFGIIQPAAPGSWIDDDE
jgi:hypothetical protein